VRLRFHVLQDTTPLKPWVAFGGFFSFRGRLDDLVSCPACLVLHNIDKLASVPSESHLGAGLEGSETGGKHAIFLPRTCRCVTEHDFIDRFEKRRPTRLQGGGVFLVSL